MPIGHVIDWQFNSVPLASFGALVLLDESYDGPSKRGDNIPIPYQHGRTWVPKYFEQRTMMFGVTIIGSDMYDFESKIDTLKALCGTRVRKYLGHHFLVGGSYNFRQALAEVQGNLGLVRDDDARVAKATITFLMAEPFLRANVLSTLTTTINASPKTFTFTHQGTAEETQAIIRLSGPLSNPVISNLHADFAAPISFTYGAAIANGHYVDVDCGKFTAIYDGVTNVVGNITHAGDPHFMVLLPGANPMSVTDGTHTTGTVRIQHYPPYL